MPAAATATPPAPQMVLGGEDDAVSFHIEISGRRRKRGDRSPARREFVPSDVGMGGDRFEAVAAQAACFRQVGEEPLERGTQEDRLLTPTGALVGFAGLEPATVGRGTDRAVGRWHAKAHEVGGGGGGAGGGRFDEDGAHEWKSRGLGARVRQQQEQRAGQCCCPALGIQPQYVVCVILTHIYMWGFSGV